MKTYAAIGKNDFIRLNSSSGGVFSALSQKFDVIYGVAMTDDCYGAEFIRVEGDISPLRGSKYFQAKVGDAFNQVLRDLENGNTVLFSGTGCQVNGLSMFLGKDYPNLLLLDIVCHGVPSAKLWREYVMDYEMKNGKLKSVNFRSKPDGWIKYGLMMNNHYMYRGDNCFMHMFLHDFCLRPSCYECHAKNCKLSDITIADFWGIDKVAPEMNDGKGTSLVITRTKKGQKYFEDISNEITWKEVCYDEAVKNNPAEFKAVLRPRERDCFFTDLRVMPFGQIEKKYAARVRLTFRSRMEKKLKSFARKVIGIVAKLL